MSMTETSTPYTRRGKDGEKPIPSRGFLFFKSLMKNVRYKARGIRWVIVNFIKIDELQDAEKVARKAYF